MPAVTRPRQPTVTVVGEVLAALQQLLAGDDRHSGQVEELQRRLSRDVLRLLVVGEAKRGKSSLLNALLGAAVLPTGVVPLTSVATVLRYGPAPRCTVLLAGAEPQPWPLERLAELVTQTENPDNRRGVAEVVVELPSPLLVGVELVDTPGVGSVHEQNTTDAQDALGRMDAAILVLTSDPPISQTERAFLRRVREQAVTVLCVLNKMDRLDGPEAEQAVAFTRSVLDAELGPGTALWPLSARYDQADPDGGAGSGLAGFRAALASYLADRRAVDLTGSLLARTRALSAAARTDDALTLSVLSAGEQDLTGRVAAFSRELAAARLSHDETHAVLDGRIRGLLAELNDSAARRTARERDGVVAAALARVGSAGRQERPAAVETAALEIAASRIRQVAEGWQADRSAWLGQQLDELDRRIAQRVDRHVRAVRDRAGELFQVSLPAPSAPGRLRQPTQPRLSFMAGPGNFDALATAVRTHLPGRLGRRRVAAHVGEQAAQLLDRNIGRTRAGLQSQLTDAGRLLQRAVDRRFADGTATISSVLDNAQALRRDGEAAVAGRRRAAQDRHAALSALLASLPDGKPAQEPGRP